MKKYILLFTLIVALSLTGCGAANDNVVHRDGNLIVTNYSDYEITDTTITHLGKTISVSPKAIKDTQICYFTIDPADDYVYTVSFVDNNGEEHSQEFTDNFTEDAQILIAIQYSDDVWTIDYDK
ncbi:hypothetical protein [Anaerostipes hominis (ex Lee et al. 2021)]|uniref:hypothetical protein n=1 Tax=Anaerostipes hominis (ex Lee et al. 2021) TaxID=2025494 RepID=UPI0022E1A132|nr:hypothetical protein [Anaerostipes hominis (ex Lee et al. 2021)]